LKAAKGCRFSAELERSSRPALHPLNHTLPIASFRFIVCDSCAACLFGRASARTCYERAPSQSPAGLLVGHRMVAVLRPLRLAVPGLRPAAAAGRRSGPRPRPPSVKPPAARLRAWQVALPAGPRPSPGWPGRLSHILSAPERTQATEMALQVTGPGGTAAAAAARARQLGHVIVTDAAYRATPSQAGTRVIMIRAAASYGAIRRAPCK
jgi:hypothetical protein